MCHPRFPHFCAGQLCTLYTDIRNYDTWRLSGTSWTHGLLLDSSIRQLLKPGDVTSVRLLFAFWNVGECYGDVSTVIGYCMAMLLWKDSVMVDNQATREVG